MSRQLELFRAGSRLAQVLPVTTSRSVAKRLGRLVGGLPDLDGRRALAASHLERVCGKPLRGAQRRQAVAELFANYALYWAESLRLPSVPHREVAAGTATVSRHFLDGALAGGKGAIIVSPHLGCWEWAAFYLTGNGLPMTVAVEPLRPPDLFEWFAQFRRQLGMEVVPVGPSAVGALLRALQANHIVCLLSDRLVAGTSGVEVEFFGSLTKLPAGPVTLAVRSGAPLLTAAAYYGRPEAAHTIVFRSPIELTTSSERGKGALRDIVRKGTQVLAYELEELIRAAPTEWHLVQPNWPGDLTVRRARCRSGPDRGAR